MSNSCRSAPTSPPSDAQPGRPGVLEISDGFAFETLAGAGTALSDRVHDHSGRVDRAGRRPVDRARADVLDRRRAVGAQWVRADVRRPPAPWRADLGPAGSPAGVHDRTAV